MSVIKSIKQVLGLGPAAETSVWDGTPSAPNVPKLTLKQGNIPNNIIEVLNGALSFPNGVKPRIWENAGLPTPDTPYTNSSKHDLIISYTYQVTGGSAAGVSIDVNGITTVAYSSTAVNGYNGVSTTVPAGGVWAVRVAGGPVTFNTARQLRAN